MSAPPAEVTAEEVRALAALAGVPVAAADLPELAAWLAEHRAAQQRLAALAELAGPDAHPAAQFDPTWE